MKNYSINASAFIVPNKMHTISTEREAYEKLRIPEPSFLTREEALMEEICTLNNTEYSDKGVVQMWFAGEGSDNFGDHGVLLHCDGEDIYAYPKCGMIPMEILEGHTEGDVLQITIPANIGRRGGKDMEKALLTIHTTLDQKGYRYRHLGAFEEVLDQVRH